MNRKAIYFCITILASLLWQSCAVSGRMIRIRPSLDRLMLVQESPPSFGMRSLMKRASTQAPLVQFLEENGLPQFIVESDSGNRQYLIMYYSESRLAYACRSWRGENDMIDFAGPYQLTERETELLRALAVGDTRRTRAMFEEQG